MRTTSAAQTPTMPQSNGERRERTAAHATNATTIDHIEERPVAGADQDPVEREDGAVQRLHQREERPERLRPLEHRRRRS